MSEEKVITLEDIKNAQAILNGKVELTPLGFSRSCTQWVGKPIYIKYENLQRTGSFKVRGAYNRIANLSEEEKKKGIVASSAGNHAQGVAYSGNELGIDTNIVMPKASSLIKRTATEGYGAKVHLHGDYYDEAYSYAKELEDKHGYTFVHPFNDPVVIAGQGTIGLEILDQLEGVDSIVVPIGGGGLISGVATAAKSINPNIKIYGVVATQAASMMGLFKENKSYKFHDHPTIADGIAVKNPNQFIYDNYISKLVDDIIDVSDDEIAEAMVFLLSRTKTVVEGASAAGLAAVKKANWELGEKTVLLLCGGNVDLNLLASVIEKGLNKSGRLARLRVRVQDKPGQLQKLTKILATQGANVLEVQHDRFAADLQLRETIVELLIETVSQDHINEIKKQIEATGSQILS